MHRSEDFACLPLGLAVLRWTRRRVDAVSMALAKVNRRARRARSATWARHECPLRLTEPSTAGTYDPSGRSDHWEMDAWSPPLAGRLLARWLDLVDRQPTRRRRSRWRGPGEAPPVCSFCGAGQPAALLGLLRAGWSAEASADHPSRVVMVPPSGPRPEPPLVADLMHFAPTELQRFNAVLRERGNLESALARTLRTLELSGVTGHAFMLTMGTDLGKAAKVRVVPS